MSQLDLLLTQYNNQSDSNKKVDLALKIAPLYRNSGRYDQGISILDEVSGLVSSTKNDLQLAYIDKELSLLYYGKLELDNAIDYGFKAVATFKKYDDKIKSSETLCNIGVYYNALNLPEKAEEYFFQSIDLYPENIPPLNNLGEHYTKVGDKVKAANYFEKAIKISKKFDRFNDLAFALKSMGELYADQGKGKEAISYFEEALEMLQYDHDPITETFIYIGLSHSHLIEKDLDKSLEFGLKGLEIANDVNNNELFWFTYSNLAEVYEELSDFENGYKYLKLSLKLHEQIYSDKITARIAGLQAAYELEKRELETKQILEKNARLATIGVMAAGITHEINQPLNSIVINSDGIIYKDDRDNILPKDYRRSVEKIFKSAQRIDEIVKHMRTYWSSGNDLRTDLPLSIDECVENVMGFVNQQIRSHGIDLQLDLASSGGKVDGNRVHIEQILINLITNAIHSLDSSQNRSKILKITTERDSDSIVLAIEDNGLGLPPDKEGEIFDPFYSSKKSDEGMGLGLAIVKNYISQLNGSIDLKNLGVDRGVIFTIKLPISKEG